MQAAVATKPTTASPRRSQITHSLTPRARHRHIIPGLKRSSRCPYVRRGSVSVQVQAAVVSKPTTPFEGQKTGTSGLRKKTQVVMQENYLANWIQSLFMALEGEAVGKTMGLGGDGRYFNKEAVQIILKLAAGAPLSCPPPSLFLSLSLSRSVSLSLFLSLSARRPSRSSSSLPPVRPLLSPSLSFSS